MKRNNLLKFILVFLSFFLIFLGWHFLINGFLGTDPYYHFKHSYLMAETGNFTLVEDWVPFHFLSTAPSDPWWLYHVAAAVLIKFFGIMAGAKILSAILGALVFTVFYYVLKKLKIFYPFVWTCVLFFFSSTFTVRLLLERPFVLSISFLLLSYYLIYKSKHLFLFLTSFLYILFYNLAPLVFFIIFIFFVVDWFYKQEINLKPIIASLSGLLAGLLIHPDIFNYLQVINIHFIKVFYLRFSGINLHSGGEIQVQSFQSFLEGNILILIIYLIATAIFIKTFLDKKSDRLQLSLFIISGFWFLISILVPRGAEYWLPFGCLFIAVIFHNINKSSDWQIIKKFIKGRVAVNYFLFFIFSFIFVFFIINIHTIYLTIYQSNQSNNNDYYFEDANNWLKENTRKDSIIYYPVWSMFPRMFFYNDHNRYLTAFDPTFFYEYDPATYYVWANISYHSAYCAQKWPCLNLTPRQELRSIRLGLKNILGAEYAIIPNKEDTRLFQVFSIIDEDFEKVYENKELVIFKVR